MSNGCFIREIIINKKLFPSFSLIKSPQRNQIIMPNSPQLFDHHHTRTQIATTPFPYQPQSNRPSIRKLRLVHRPIARFLHNLTCRIQHILRRQMLTSLKQNQLPFTTTIVTIFSVFKLLIPLLEIILFLPLKIPDQQRRNHHHPSHQTNHNTSNHTSPQTRPPSFTPLQRGPT
ncbi:hypothetical protein HanXRQr2_Chr04g0169461 [Helianthus annuus]|uniref:Uncharacterized protein n=1 Tax=Helianthus annuus TaxID=4232 RepID=A0A9K3NSL5_HELAN|nr:hypothetical protein HanXRQr2_Chr04g0169461 [Helianthus annuus]KAJ0931555.1 hypothetical protein HanPSC8_Chr04g0163071 [Helianthus annuus]